MVFSGDLWRGFFELSMQGCSTGVWDQKYRSENSIYYETFDTTNLNPETVADGVKIHSDLNVTVFNTRDRESVIVMALSFNIERQFDCEDPP